MEADSSKADPVVVDGATGYVGSHLVWALRKKGKIVRCIVRPQANKADIDFLASTGAEIVSADLQDKSEKLINAFSGASAVVHLIGSIAPRRGEKLEQLHAGQTGQVVELCRSNDCKLILLTALGTSRQAASDYHKTKWAAEEAVKNSGLNYVILRPSLLVGRQVGSRDSKLVRRYRELLQTKKVVPLVAGGNGLVQPLFVGDLAEALSAVIERADWDKQTLELGGSETLSMRQFVEKLQDVLGIHKPLVTLAEPVARLAAFLSQTFQPVPLLSQDQVTLSLQDNVCANNVVAALLGRQPISVNKALMSYGSEAPNVVQAAAG